MASDDLSVLRQCRYYSSRADGMDADHGDQGLVYGRANYDGNNIGCFGDRRFGSPVADKGAGKDAERPKPDAVDDVRS